MLLVCCSIPYKTRERERKRQTDRQPDREKERKKGRKAIIPPLSKLFKMLSLVSSYAIKYPATPNKLKIIPLITIKGSKNDRKW